MNIIKDKVLTFNGIKPGTVFTSGDKTYIKTDKNFAVDLYTGYVLTETDSLNMTSCVIHPRATIRLS